MTYSPELCNLIIQNMHVIESAPKIVDTIEKTIFIGINRCCEKFSGDMGWSGVFNLVEVKKKEKQPLRQIIGVRKRMENI